MEKEINISSEQINSFISQTDSTHSTAESIERAMKNSLTESQIEAVKNILSDEEKMKKLLSSPFAKALLEKYKKG